MSSYIYKTSGAKRKRGEYSSDAKALALYRPVYKSPYKKKKMFVPGQDRTSGFYGRFAPYGGELKFKDVDLDDAVVSGTGTVTNTICTMIQGTAEDERIGRKCTVRQVNWRYHITLPEVDAAATPTNGDSVRMIMYLDKQANGATAAVTDLLETANLKSFRNLANTNRFVFLCDKIHNINYAGMASDGAGVVSQGLVIQNKEFYKKVNIPIEYDGIGAAISNIKSNNIGILLISSTGVAGFESKLRVRFSDN